MDTKGGKGGGGVIGHTEQERGHRSATHRARGTGILGIF